MGVETRSYDRELAQLKDGTIARIAALSEKLAAPVQADRPLLTKIADGFENLIRRLHVPFYQDRRTRTKLALARAEGGLSILQEICSLSIADMADGQWDANLILEDGDRVTLNGYWVTLSCRQVHERVGRSEWWRPEYQARSTMPHVQKEDLLNTYVWVVEAALKIPLGTF